MQLRSMLFAKKFVLGKSSSWAMKKLFFKTVSELTRPVLMGLNQKQFLKFVHFKFCSGGPVISSLSFQKREKSF